MKELSDEDFIAMWNAGSSLAAVLEQVCERQEIRVPRWAILARAVGLRNAGRELKSFPDEMRTQRSAAIELLTSARDTALKLMHTHGLASWTFALNNNLRRAGVCRYPTPTRPGRIEEIGRAHV